MKDARLQGQLAALGSELRQIRHAAGPGGPKATVQTYRIESGRCSVHAMARLARDLGYELRIDLAKSATGE